MSWMDGIDKSKHDPATLKRWRQDEIRAKKQHEELMKNPHRNLPDTAPARMAYEERQYEKQRAKNAKRAKRAKRPSISRSELKPITKALKKAMRD